MTYPVRVSQEQYYGYGDAHTVNIPSGSNGQTILLFIGSNGNPTMSSAPSGFTLIDSWTTGTAAKLFLYYRVTDGSEGSTVSFTLSGDFDVACRLLRYRNLRSGAVADWLYYSSATANGVSFLETATADSGFTYNEYFTHLAYGFFTGSTSLVAYPGSLPDVRDFDVHTGTDSDVGSTLASGETLSDYFSSVYWDITYGLLIDFVALNMVLRGDTLDPVGQDREITYGLGGWVRSDDYPGTFEWNYPEQPTATLGPVYSVFKYAGSETTLVEDNFTGAAGSIYSHTPDEGSTWAYGFGDPGDDTTPPQIDGSGWLKPYGAAAAIYIYQAVSVSSNYYSVEATIKFQGESGASSQYAAVVLKDSNSNDRVQFYLSLTSGNLSVDFAAQADGGSVYHSVDLGDATPLIDNTYTVRVEVTDDILAACFVNGTLVKVLAPPGPIPNPARLYINGYYIGETSGDPNFILDHVQFSEGVAGATSVGQNFSAQWNSDSTVFSDLEAQFKVGFDPVSQDWSAEFDIIAVAGASIATEYDVDSLLPSVAAQTLFHFTSASTPVDQQIPIPDGARVGDIVLVVNPYYYLNHDELTVVKWDTTALSRINANLAYVWHKRVGAVPTPSHVVVPASDQSGGKFYLFAVLVLRNINEGAAVTDWFSARHRVSQYEGAGDDYFSFERAYTFEAGYEEWTDGKYFLHVGLLAPWDAPYQPSLSGFEYPTLFTRNREVDNSGSLLAISSRVTNDADIDYRWSDSPVNPDTQYYVLPAWATEIANTILFSFRGVDPIRADLPITYGVFEYVERDFSAVWFANPKHVVAFVLNYGFSLSGGFNIEYRIDEKSVSGFDVAYALPPTLRVGFEVSFAGEVSSDFVVGATLGSTPFCSFDTGYALVSVVRADFGVAYSDSVASSFDASSGLWAVPAYSFSVTHALVEQRAVTFDASWVLKSISMSFELGASLVSKVQKSVNVVSALIAKIVAGVDVGFSINNTDTVRAAFDFGYFYSSNSVVLTQTTPSVFVDGRTIDVVSAEVSTDEGGDFWEASFTIGELADFSVFSVNKAFSLFFCGEEYRLIVDSRAIDRSNPEQVTATIYGVSPAKVYQAPRAVLVSKTWDTPKLASEIALELISALQWQTIDWVIDAGLFGLEEASPLDGVKTLAEVVGAVFESLPDGTMRVRPKYPVSVPNFGTATSSFTITDRVDNFSYSEKYTPNKLENLITITDEQNDLQDRVEFIEDEYDKERGVIRVYPAVWRWTVSIRPTGSIRSYAYDGVVTREEEEEVEFVNGAASTSYPVVDIVSAVWNTTDLGSVGFKFYKQELTCSVASDAYSLLKIKYVTQTHNFSIVGTYDTSVQFVVENV